MIDLLDRIDGWRCPSSLFQGDAFMVRLGRETIDREGYPHQLRINGAIQCPKCGLFWPLIEDSDEWTRVDGKWRVSGFGLGMAECIECRKVFVENFDGVHELLLEPDA